jgi:hypothetical protein
MGHTYFASSVLDSGHILAWCTCDRWRSWQYFVPPARGVNEAVARSLLAREHDRHLSDSTKLATEKGETL